MSIAPTSKAPETPPTTLDPLLESAPTEPSKCAKPSILADRLQKLTLDPPSTTTEKDDDEPLCYDIPKESSYRIRASKLLAFTERFERVVAQLPDLTTFQAGEESHLLPYPYDTFRSSNKFVASLQVRQAKNENTHYRATTALWYLETGLQTLQEEVSGVAPGRSYLRCQLDIQFMKRSLLAWKEANAKKIEKTMR